MKRVFKFASGLGCLMSVAGPFLALVLYPRAKWLFAFVLIGFAILWLNHRFAKDPTPQALADQIEHLLNGDYYGWDVDDFEMQAIRDPQLQDLHRRSMKFGGLPEEWVRLSEERKNQMRELIAELRKLDYASSAGTLAIRRSKWLQRRLRHPPRTRPRHDCCSISTPQEPAPVSNE